ncbi:MAG: hypothetical protein IJA87_04565 [Clostridia bacterium]|nr:hypothetical protein [Clostridia bacterium]
MKDMKKNSVQLVIAGIVVVLVAICGTFAWFSTGGRSWVRHIGANMESPSTEESIDSGISEIQIYDPISDNWKDYDGEIPLDFVPGKNYSFKVLFNADESQHNWLRLTGFEEPAEGTANLINALEYSVKITSGSADDYKSFEISHKEDNKPYVELISQKSVTEYTEKEDNMYVLYYDIRLPGTAGNDYFDQSFTADVELIFQ